MLPVSIEQQLLSIAGSAEVAAVLASALGFEQVPCSRSSSMCGGINSVGGASVSMAGALAAAAGGSGSFSFISCRESTCQSGKSSLGNSRPGSVIARLSSSTSKALAEGLAGERSTPGAAQHQQQQRRRWRRPQKPSSTLMLQQVQLPPGCCRSIGAVCYMCPHLKRVVLVGVGLTDQDVGDLVDALKVRCTGVGSERVHFKLYTSPCRYFSVWADRQGSTYTFSAMLSSNACCNEGRLMGSKGQPIHSSMPYCFAWVWRVVVKQCF